MNKFLVNFLLLIIVQLLSPEHLVGQGFPVIDSYDITNYDAFQQSWEFVQDTNGIVYIGHGGGILQFDGVKWTTKHGEAERHILRLEKANDGTIYYGSEGEFGYLKPDSINTFNLVDLSLFYDDSTITIGDIYDVHESNELIYFTSSSGLFTWDSQNIHFTPTDFIISRSFSFNEDVIIKSLNGGLYKHTGEEFQFIEGSQIFEQNYIYTILNYQNKMLLGTRKNGFYIYDGLTFSHLQLDNKLTDDLDQAFRAIMINEDAIAIATLNAGIFIVNLKNNSIQKIDNKNENLSLNQLRNNMTLGLMLDSEQQLWVATVDGVSKLQVNIPIEIYDELSGLENGGRTILEIGDTIYIGTQNGLFKSQKNIQERIIFEKISDYAINQLKTDGTNLFAASTEGILIVNDNTIKKIGAQYVISLEQFKDQLFFTDGNKIYVIKLDSSQKITETKLTGSFYDIFEHNNFLYLLDTDKRVRKIDPLSLKEITFSNNEIPQSSLKSYINVINDTLRIGTFKGLYKYVESNNSIIKDYSFADSKISEEQVFMFNEVSTDTVWFWNDQRMRVFIREKNKWNVQESIYNILSEKTSPVATLKKDKNFWIITSRNVKKISKLDWEYKTDFKTNITGIYVKNDSLIYGGFGEPTKELVLPYKDNQLRFTFAAASYIDIERNTYSTKLEGFDKDWSSWTNEPQKDYTNIPEGDYVFKVRSKNVFEVEGRMDSIPFNVLPPWYRTWWAYLGYFIGIVAILYTAYNIRINQILKVERMRNRIAGDLHDEVSATLTGISYFAEAVKRDPNPDKKEHFMTLITESAGDAKDKITDIVWSINPDNDNWELFLSKCRRFASDLLESKGLKYELKIVENIPGKFNMELRQQLWLIFKEMVTNAVRHSEASRLDIIMDVEGNKLKLVVQDDGKGFDVDTLKRGNGVTNIQKRATAIKAKIELDSSVGFGTRWKMILPLG